MSCLKSAPSKLSNCKILQKDKNVEICDEKSLIWVFWDWNLKKKKKKKRKNHYHVLNKQPRICLIVKIREKIKMPKFANKKS